MNSKIYQYRVVERKGQTNGVRVGQLVLREWLGPPARKSGPKPQPLIEHQCHVTRTIEGVEVGYYILEFCREAPPKVAHAYFANPNVKARKGHP